MTGEGGEEGGALSGGRSPCTQLTVVAFVVVELSLVEVDNIRTHIVQEVLVV